MLVTMIDGGEVDYACLTCRKRFFGKPTESVCPKCGTPLTDHTNEVYEIKLTETGYRAVKTDYVAVEQEETENDEM